MSKHIVFWGLCAVLVFVPLPIGSVEEWAVFVFEAATIGLFLVYLGGEIGRLRRRSAVTGRDASQEGPRNAGGFERVGAGRKTGRGLIGGDAADDEAGLGHSLPRFFNCLLGIFLAISLLQLVPLPAGVVKVLSPHAYDMFLGLVRDGITAPSSWLTLSLAPRATLSELILILCYGIFGFLVVRTVRSRRRIEIFVLVIIASALFQAFYGMAEVFSGHETILGRVKRYNLGSVTGTFVNRNHLAGFLEMAFPLSLGYLLAKARYFAMEKGLSLRQRILWFGQESLQWTLLLGLVPVFIGVGLVFSKSRSGVMVLVVTALLAAIAAASWRDISVEAGSGEGERGSGERGAHRRLGRLVRLISAAVLAAAVWIGVGPIVERFGEMDITKEARQTFYKNTVELVGDFPWTGTGKGTYVNAYAMYEKVDDHMKLSFAHNDYLEFAAENGVVGGGALAAAGIGLAVWLAAMWRRRRDNFAKGVGLGALLGVAALLIHGFTDFNLQIPANAVYFTAIAMLGAVVLGKKNGDTYKEYMSPEEGGHVRRGADSEERPSEVRRSGSELRFWEISKKSLKNKGAHVPGKSRRLAWFGRPHRGKIGDMYRRYVSPFELLTAGLLALLLFVPAFHDFSGFHYLGQYRRARSEARSVESAFPALEALLEKAVNASPRPEFRLELARLYTEMARVSSEAGRDEKRETFCDRAVSAFERAIAANPIDAFTYYETGIVYLLYNYPLMTYADRAMTYFRKAIELKPADEFLNLNVLFLYFTRWDTLEDADKDYAAGLFRQAVARDPGFGAKLEARWTQSFKTPDRLRAILAELPR